MKKVMYLFLLVLLLLCTSCSHLGTASNTVSNLSDTAVPLEKGVWPENEYTNGLPVSPGTVSQAFLDPEKGYCSIFLTDITDEEYQAYLEKLRQNGFQVVEEVSEEIDGQDYVSIGTLLSDGTWGVSLSHLPDQLTIYISAMQK